MKKILKILQLNYKIFLQYSRCMVDDILILLFLVFDVEEVIENFIEGFNVVEVVQDDDIGEFFYFCVFILFCDVGQVLSEFFG